MLGQPGVPAGTHPYGHGLAPGVVSARHKGTGRAKDQAGDLVGTYACVRGATGWGTVVGKRALEERRAMVSGFEVSSMILTSCQSYSVQLKSVNFC